MLLLKNIKFLLPTVLLLLVSMVSYNLGVRLTEAKYEKALLDAREVQDTLAARLDAAVQKIKNKKAADVKTIYVEKDPTGCADTVVPDRMLEAILGDKPSTD